MAPAGWHLPSRDEWRAFRAALGGKRCVFKYLGGTMEKVYKQVVPGGSSGFDAQLGGRRTPSGRFVEMGERAYFWSATMDETGESEWFFTLDSKPGGVRRGLFDSREGTAGLGRYFAPTQSLSVRLFRN